jgi:hypothetical protein
METDPRKKERECAIGISTVVEHSTDNPEIKGLNLANRTGREKTVKKSAANDTLYCDLKINYFCCYYQNRMT